jgi:hypothetical protein
MRHFKTLITQLLLVTSLMLPWATTEALETFKQSGAITKYNSSKFVMNSQVYRLSPTAEFPSGSRPDYEAFKKGDIVYIEGKILSGIRYVDVMIFFPPESS